MSLASSFKYRSNSYAYNYCKFVNLRIMITCNFRIFTVTMTRRNSFVAIHFSIMHTQIQKYIPPQKNNKKNAFIILCALHTVHCHFQTLTGSNTQQTQINTRDCMQIAGSSVALARIILSFCYDRISSIMKCGSTTRLQHGSFILLL